MKPLGKTYADAPANTGDFQRLPAGGYIAKIQAVTDLPDKEYLRITFDIAEGEFKGFYANTDADHEYLHQFISSYKEKAMGMFKGFLKNVDASNNTSFETQAEKGFDERQLVGKLVGIILGYEEYENNRGDVATRARINTRAVEIIRAGRFNVPELKKLVNGSGKPAATTAPAAATGPGTSLPEFQQITDDDIPF